MNNSEFLETAVKAAKLAADIHLHYFHLDIEISFKSTHYDMVTKADIEAEEKIISVIKERFPDHNILAEEKIYEKTTSAYLWIIDPLDGTNNFAHKIPIFSVSIACAKDGKIFAGVVYDPNRNELFSAYKGKGALLNNNPIHVTDSKNLQQSILATGFYYNRGKVVEKTLENIKNFFENGVVGIRRMGSAALDLCNVACGRLDGFWEHLLSPWDFSAGILIVKEAGGKATDNLGKKLPVKPSYIVASNSKIHDTMLKLIK